jgi:hypothetical protein
LHSPIGPRRRPAHELGGAPNSTGFERLLRVHANELLARELAACEW